MPEPSHLPAPWEATRAGVVRWPRCKNRDGKPTSSIICTVHLPGENEFFTLTGKPGDAAQAQVIQAANTRLIAASPAMLETLQGALPVLAAYYKEQEKRHGPLPDGAYWLDAANLAIATAMGR